MAQQLFHVEGMTCMHCKMAVEKALQAVPGVNKAQVDLEKKQAVVEGNAERKDLAQAIEEAGYQVVEQ